jgi:formiminotetrahydrofolate cyclodeaminase
MSLACDSNKDMKSTVSHSTIESLRGHIAGAKDPIVAGVAVSAVSAGLGMGLLALTLKVASRRKDFAGDRARLNRLLDTVNKESVRLVRYADQDIAAYQKYRDSLKHKRGVDAALRRIVETPLEAAGSAAHGLDLCAEAVPLVPLSVASDLSAAEALLAGAVRAILFTVDVNLLQLPAKSELRRGASRQVERIRRRVAG